MPITHPTPHLDKLNAALSNEKLPDHERPSLEKALEAYRQWIALMVKIRPVDEGQKIEQVVSNLVETLNKYKLYIDLQVVFDSPGDFLYRQKGQLKLDNTIIEEFLPHLIYKTIPELRDGYEIGPKSCFSAIYFESGVGRILLGGGPQIRKKDQDFAISRQLFIKTSHDQNFEKAVERNTYLGYIVAECKTNLDKTMFQESTATAHDVKASVPGCRYYLLCEWLDMTPVSTASTDIDEVIILRKAKRVSSHIRKNFSTVAGRTQYRAKFEQFLQDNPFDAQVILRFVNHIISTLQNQNPLEGDVLETGYF